MERSSSEPGKGTTYKDNSFLCRVGWHLWEWYDYERTMQRCEDCGKIRDVVRENENA